jgi:membrane protease YdiL (CAAX protease family)
MKIKFLIYIKNKYLPGFNLQSLLLFLLIRQIYQLTLGEEYTVYWLYSVVIFLLWAIHWKDILYRLSDKPKVPTLRFTAVTIFAAFINRILWHWQGGRYFDFVKFTPIGFFDDAVAPALLEEFLFRFFVYQCLKDRLNDKRALLFCGMVLITVASHNLNTPITSLAVTNFAIIQTIHWFKTKDLKVCMIQHLVWNSVQFLPLFV